MSQEISNTGEPDVTDDAPVNREPRERRGFRLSTPIGDFAIAVSTPKRRPAIPKRFDPFGVADRALGAATAGLKLALWSGEQLAALGKTSLVALENATPRELAPSTPEPPVQETLNTKLGKLLDKALDQSTAESQNEFYHRLLDQLVADEARIVGALSDGGSSPLVNVYTRRGQLVLTNACLVGRTANVALPKMVPQYVGHLLDLGLVETGPEDPTQDVDYEILTAEPIVLDATKRATRGPLPARVEKLTLSLSDLGRGLWAAAIAQEES
ncbi:hypothetical protein ABIA30_002233 [Mycobacterium sp. MAA66]|uniref:Abi-alpha family protein n=1 Tax=Mycobacterium sp. MAA66 TaxID=3156297 RepID=UPI003514CDDD